MQLALQEHTCIYNKRTLIEAKEVCKKVKRCLENVYYTGVHLSTLAQQFNYTTDLIMTLTRGILIPRSWITYFKYTFLSVIQFRQRNNITMSMGFWNSEKV